MLRIGNDVSEPYKNIFDRYVCRPRHLEHLSLGEFVIWSDLVASQWNDINGDEQNIDAYEMEQDNTDNRQPWCRKWQNVKVTCRTNKSIAHDNYENGVIATAPTSVEARLIGDSTLHATFALRIEKGRTEVLRSMAGERLQREHQKWWHVKWVVIDEMSMVPYLTLRNVHLRLQQYKERELPQAVFLEFDDSSITSIRPGIGVLIEPCTTDFDTLRGKRKIE
ncbi:unnamed protein product [Parnassius apollo]|uniref:(apollo) hypothetical protein n=1 Tax=Parnassius apollo TaxID=110799 RepID=A0A8S3W9Y3_PARAO|nr:unnamed protein product [Parnassius apollo]